MKINVTRGKEISKEFGKISRIEFPDKSKIYISKKGWNLVTPDGKEINIPYSEIQVAIDETILRGYVNTKNTEKEDKPTNAKMMASILTQEICTEYGKLKHLVNDKKVERYINSLSTEKLKEANK